MRVWCWCVWHAQGWAAYVKMELRYSEVERARAIYERYVQCHPTVRAPAPFHVLIPLPSTALSGCLRAQAGACLERDLSVRDRVCGVRMSAVQGVDALRKV